MILDGSLTDAASRQRALDGVRLTIGGLSVAAQKELGELFMLLAWAPLRGPLTGVWSDWPQASPQEVAAFLDRWKHSRLALLNSGYQALRDIVLGAWYADPSTWADIGYPGPPTLP